MASKKNKFDGRNNLTCPETNRILEDEVKARLCSEWAEGLAKQLGIPVHYVWAQVYARFREMTGV